MKIINTLFGNRHSVAQTTRALISLFIAVGLLALNPAHRSVVARSEANDIVVTPTISALPLTGTFQTVSNLYGDQTDPHIDGDLTSYSSDDYFGSVEIRYFDFATNLERAIPGNGINRLSDVSGQHISFLEATVDGPHLIIFDTVSQTRTVVPGLGHWGSALGGNVLAFEQRTFVPVNDWITHEADIGVYQLSTGAITWLTDDTLFDKTPSVSPAGNLVAWSRCQTNLSGCDIYIATQTAPGVFNTQALTGASGEDFVPRTNGELVVYLSTRDGETDIYYQPVAGGAETRISIPGRQQNPNISGNLISFESETPNNFNDVFVYDINTANLYQVTNTPTLLEVLSDISVRNGIARIVYGATAGDYDVHAFTFTIPSSTEDQINDLIELVESFGLPRGPENSLITKLDDALAAIAAGNTANACSSLTAFINESSAQSGKKLTADQAAQLITPAQEIKLDLGCQ